MKPENKLAQSEIRRYELVFDRKYGAHFCYLKVANF